MTFEEWWKDLDKDYSVYAIPDEIKWFAERAWNQAVNVMIEQEEKSKNIDKEDIYYNQGDNP